MCMHVYECMICVFTSHAYVYMNGLCLYKLEYLHKFICIYIIYIILPAFIFLQLMLHVSKCMQ